MVCAVHQRGWDCALELLGASRDFGVLPVFVVWIWRFDSMMALMDAERVDRLPRRGCLVGCRGAVSHEAAMDGLLCV